MTWEGLGCTRVLGGQRFGLGGSPAHLGGTNENDGSENEVRCEDGLYVIQLEVYQGYNKKKLYTVCIHRKQE